MIRMNLAQDKYKCNIFRNSVLWSLREVICFDQLNTYNINGKDLKLKILNISSKFFSIPGLFFQVLQSGFFIFYCYLVPLHLHRQVSIIKCKVPAYYFNFLSFIRCICRHMSCSFSWADHKITKCVIRFYFDWKNFMSFLRGAGRKNISLSKNKALPNYFLYADRSKELQHFFTAVFYLRQQTNFISKSLRNI